MVGFGNDETTGFLDLVVQTADNSVKVLSWRDGDGFSVAKVYTSATNHTAIKTLNSLSTAPHDWSGDEPQFARGLIAGRGGVTSSSDDTTGWTALYSPQYERWYLTDSWTGSDGNPTFNILTDGFHRGFDLARFGTGMKARLMGTSTWSALTGCSVSGSPVVTAGIQDAAFIRGTSGALTLVAPSPSGGGVCVTQNLSLSSAPITYRGGGLLYTGTNGNFWVDQAGESPKDMGIQVK
jgi:hypothetical protein